MAFPAAAQPDIVRASQKDEGYRTHLADLCQDAVRRVLGPRRAILCSRETDLVAGLLYHALTTGCGQQTLGEEYCDILQTAGQPGTAPGLARRTALAALDAVGPYASSLLQEQYGAVDQPLWSASRALRDNLLTAAAAALPWALRLHLALFYLTGTYYQWPKRLTGTRYEFLGKLFERRPSYRLLGVLMFAQLVTNAAFWALQQRQSSAKDGPDAGGSAAPGQPQVAAVLEEPGTAIAPPVSGHRCPLCLSARTAPTATPCGHVFCWACIAEWANQKPECPLCRSPVVGSDLVCVQHADF